MVFSKRKMKQLFAFGVALVLVVCLYKSWGSPATGGAKLSLGGIGSLNDLENSVDRGRYAAHQRQAVPKLPEEGEGNGENEVANDHRRVVVVGGGAVGEDEGHETRLNELHEAKKQILQLQQKIQELEGRIPRKYPDVMFLNYKNRMRILGSDDKCFLKF